MIVHKNVFVPVLRFVIVELYWVELLTMPKPLTVVHKPEPMAGLFADKVAVVPQVDWSKPAAATEGRLFVTFTSSKTVQPVRVTVQRNTLVPELRPVTAVLNSAGFASVAEPTGIVQTPVPESGSVPSRELLAAQRTWSPPALTVKELFVTTSSSDEEHPLLVIVQRKRFTPALRPETLVLKFIGEVIVPKPVTTDHCPLP